VSTRRERKIVTVLFADLVGFTARAESLDPEDVDAFLRPFHARVRGELERHGGTVEKFVGDAVMALFGAPQAHEDDPERAVRAALAIREWSREEQLELRIGITTGEALVALEARPEAGEGMASGDVVNTASRLQEAGEADAILVDEVTYRSTDQAIVYVDREPIEAKGKAEPIRVHAAIEARSRFGVEVEQRPQTPLVGRERERSLLFDALARSREDREPQLVTLVGVPGIGKSRLVYELLQAVDDEPELITWRQGRCLPYGEGVSYWAVGEMVKAQAGILDTDPADAAAGKLGNAVGAVAVEDAEWIVSHLRPLVGLADEDEGTDENRVEAFAAWRRFFEALAEVRPLVLVFEDLHWADEGVLDFVDHLVDWASGVPLLVVATSRPELLERRPGWGGGKVNASTLALPPLSDGDAARLVGQLVGSVVLPAETQRALLARAGGNPLYAEQYAKLFMELGSAEDLPLPETVQGIIAARLDALTAGEKAALQDAAVVGKVFWPAALTELGSNGSLPQLLRSLERKEFIRRERRSTVGGQTEYAFRHALVRDVAYAQIPRAQRAEKHRRAAEWIEGLSERSDDVAEMLAHHYVSALELTEAAGGDTVELALHARLALRRAGERALSLNALPAAQRFLSSALGLWPADDPERPLLELVLARVLNWRGELREEPLLDARDALLRRGDLAHAAEAETMLGWHWWNAGYADEFGRHWSSASDLVDRAAPSRAVAWVHAQLAVQSLVSERFEEGIARAGKAAELAEQFSLEEIGAHALITIGSCRFGLGDPDALADIEAGLEAGEALSAAEIVIRGCKNLGDSLVRDGALERGFEVQQRGLEAALRFGDRFHVRWFRGERSLECYVRGLWDEAVVLADEMIAEVEAGSPHYLESTCRYVRALVRLAREDDEGAIADSARLVEIAEMLPDPQVAQPSLVARARVLVETGRAAEAAALLDSAGGRIGREGLGLSDLAIVTAELGRSPAGLTSLARHGRLAAAAEAVLAGDYARAADLYGGIGSRPDEADARLRAAAALVESGRRAEADAQLGAALAFYRSVGATRYVRKGEQLLAATA